MENESRRERFTPFQTGLLKNSTFRFSVQAQLQWLQIGSKIKNCDVPWAQEPISSFVSSLPSRGCSLRTMCAAFFLRAKTGPLFSPLRNKLWTHNIKHAVLPGGTGPVAILKLHPLAATITLYFRKLLRATERPGPAVERWLGSSSGQRGQGWVDQWRGRKQFEPANNHVGQVQII